MPRSLIEAYERDLGVNVVHAWGMTELSPLGTVCKLQRQHDALSAAERWDVKARQGHAPRGGPSCASSATTAPSARGDGETMGELQARGPWVIRSYFKREPTPENLHRRRLVPPPATSAP